MRKHLVLTSLILIFLMSPRIGALELQASNANKSSTLPSVKKIIIQNKKKKSNSIDGSTSASKLRAKKSHHVSKKNETILSVFLGLISIGFIVFFLKILGNRE